MNKIKQRKKNSHYTSINQDKSRRESIRGTRFAPYILIPAYLQTNAINST